MNTEDSKTSESKKFTYQFTNKVFITRGKTLNQCITTINLKYLVQLGIMNFICLMDHIQS